MTLLQAMNIALIIVAIALTLAIILQSKEAGLGGLTSSESGGVFRARRGLEKMLFYITIGLGVTFFALSIATIFVPG